MLSDEAFVQVICWFFFLLGILFMYIGGTLSKSNETSKANSGKNLVIAGAVFVIPLSLLSFYNIWIK